MVSPQVNEETPARPKSDHTDFSYQTGILENARLAVLQDLGISIPQVKFQEFLEFLAPPQPKFNLDLTMKSLKKGILSSGRWSAFDIPPKDQQQHEDIVFSPIVNIFNKVVDTIVANSELTEASNLVQFLSRPAESPTSCTRQSTYRPDGYLVLKQRPQVEPVPWADIALSCEYKRKDRKEDLYDDVCKCIWSMQHIMRDDPCRRATFAMTIENVNMRLWFCCRSSVVVSEPFDFVSEPELLVKVFAAFAFADKKSLGFDPTIERVPDQQFIFTVHPDLDREKPRRFLTKSIISSSGADPLRGRGTRIFKAVEIDQHGSEKGDDVVLKDVWTDSDRAREGVILAQLHDEAKGDDKPLVKKHFLGIICHSDVWLDSEVDDTEKGIMHGLKTTNSTFWLPCGKDVSISGLSSNRPESLCAMNLLNRHFPTNYSHKTHYRIVFKEQGTTIGELSLFYDVLETLTGAVDALKLLHRLGWVHRDVSIGNILRCKEGTKLVDLEYAKKVSNTTSHNMRTGTLHFMSIEGAAHRYLFTRPNKDASKFWHLTQAGLQNVSTLPWTYNHFHDLESLWWVAVWIVFTNCFSLPGDRRSDLPVIPEDLKTALFPSTLTDFRRRDNFTNEFPAMENKMPPKHKLAFRCLNFLRAQLVQHYENVELTLLDSINLNASDDGIYNDFKEGFNNLLGLCPNYTLVPNVERAKREREESPDAKAHSRRRL